MMIMTKSDKEHLKTMLLEFRLHTRTWDRRIAGSRIIHSFLSNFHKESVRTYFEELLRSKFVRYECFMFFGEYLDNNEVIKRVLKEFNENPAENIKILSDFFYSACDKIPDKIAEQFFNCILSHGNIWDICLAFKKVNRYNKTLIDKFVNRIEEGSKRDIYIFLNDNWNAIKLDNAMRLFEKLIQYRAIDQIIGSTKVKSISRKEFIDSVLKYGNVNQCLKLARKSPDLIDERLIKKIIESNNPKFIYMLADKNKHLGDKLVNAILKTENPLWIWRFFKNIGVKDNNKLKKWLEKSDKGLIYLLKNR